MPLVSIVEQLKQGRSERYAVPLFDTFNMETSEGMFQALEETHTPGIIAIYSGLLEHPNAPALAAYLPRARRSRAGAGRPGAGPRAVVRALHDRH